MDAQDLPAVHWLPRLQAGHRFQAAGHVQACVTAAWLLMTELHTFLEDLDGARQVPQAAALVKVKLAELLVEIDCVLARIAPPAEPHRLPLLLEYGLSDVAALSGPQAAALLGLHRPTDSAEVDRLHRLLSGLVQAFPGDLVNAQLAQHRGRVLRFLRAANKACDQVGIDAAFLVPLMRAL